jgi:anaerobic magnesium-protoporphyrin IX monomethyl ester cyclase
MAHGRRVPLPAKSLLMYPLPPLTEVTAKRTADALVGDVLLLSPPATDPRSPHLALPSLAASLRAAGVRVGMIDLALEGLLYLLRPARLQAAVAACVGRLGRSSEQGRSRLESALQHADGVLAAIESALVTLRCEDRFADPHLLQRARECVGTALELTAAAAGPVQYGIGQIRYDVEGVHADRLADLDRVTADPRYNLFADFYHERVLDPLEQNRPRLVGVSILNYQQILPGLMLCRLLKARGHFVVIGGTVYSKFVPQLLQRPRFFDLFCDGVVAYEGEAALLELLAQLQGKRDFARVPNFLHLRPDGVPACGPTHVMDVDDLPTPDFEGLPLPLYLTPQPVLPILTGKGCYFNECKFCDIPSINSVSRKKYRVRSPERIAADLVALQQRHGARHFLITDEALSPRLLLAIGEALGPASDLRFTGYARLEREFTAGVCERLRGMGVRKLFFGLESGSQTPLDRVRKGIRVEDARAVLRNCAHAGIAFHVFSIVGFPEETEELAEETLNFFLKQESLFRDPRHSFDVHPFSLDQRTEFADSPQRYGSEIDADDMATRDFPLAVPRWRNLRGMSQTQTHALLERFQTTLRERYKASRQFPAHLWPAFEEYSLLYADAYAGRAFGFRLALPEDSDPLLFELTWAPGVRRQPIEGAVRLSCLTGTAIASTVTLTLLDDALGGERTAAQWLGALSSRLSEAPVIQALVRQRLRAELNALLAIEALLLIPGATQTGRIANGK